MSMMDDGEADIDWGSLEKLFAEVDKDQDSVVSLSDQDLLDRFADTTQQLTRRKELRFPRTQEARDLHSERAACLLELRRRKMPE